MKTGRSLLFATPLIILGIIISIFILTPETHFSEDAVKELESDGWELVENVTFKELRTLDPYNYGMWGGDDLQEGSRWIYERGNESLVVRTRTFKTEDLSKSVFEDVHESESTTSNIHYVKDFRFKDGAFSCLFLDIGHDALVLIIRDKSSMIEVAYSNIRKNDYNTSNFYSDKKWFIPLAKSLWRKA